MAAIQVPLEHLDIEAAIQPIYDTICNIKTIKRLHLLDADELDIIRLQRICTKLSELTDLFVGKKCDGLNPRDLLELVRKAKKLQCITFAGSYIKINSATYASLMDILRTRDDKTRLLIRVCEASYEQVTYNQTYQNSLFIIPYPIK